MYVALLVLVALAAVFSSAGAAPEPKKGGFRKGGFVGGFGGHRVVRPVVHRVVRPVPVVKHVPVVQHVPVVKHVGVSHGGYGGHGHGGYGGHW